MRRLGEARGAVVGVAVRHQPRVTGDGRHGIGQLIEADPRLARLLGHYRATLGEAWLSRVPRSGEKAVLGTVASLRVGGRYEDAKRLRTAALEARVDAVARSMDGFHFGRLDVRFTTGAALRAGQFRIIEVNGAGSEAIQFWDPGLKLSEAYRGVFDKQRALFDLAAEFRAAGHRPVGVARLARAWLAQQRLTRGYPASN